MRNTVTAAEIARYREQGFVIIDNLLRPAEVDELAAGVERGVRALGERQRAGAGWSDGDAWYQGVFLQRLNLWKVDATVRRFLLGGELGAMAAALAGVPALRVWHDQTLQKGPWANATSWHLDDPSWSFTSRDAISAWIALDDATIANGCMWFIPGSHRLARTESCGIGENMGDLFKLYPELATMAAVPAPVPRGGCVFHNGLTAHAAGPNMTPGWRRAMVCIAMPAGSVYNGIPNVLSQQRLARLRVGDPLDDDDENPLLHGEECAVVQPTP